MTYKELEDKINALPFPPPMIWFNTPEKWSYYRHKYGNADWFLQMNKPFKCILWQRKSND